MCRSMVDIQSATTEIRRGKERRRRKKKRQDENITACPIPHWWHWGSVWCTYGISVERCWHGVVVKHRQTHDEQQDVTWTRAGIHSVTDTCQLHCICHVILCSWHLNLVSRQQRPKCKHTVRICRNSLSSCPVTMFSYDLSARFVFHTDQWCVQDFILRV